MGMDVCTHLVFGIKLPEEFKIDTDEKSYMEEFENIFYSTEKPYPNLDMVLIGDCQEPDIFIVSEDYSAEWTASPIELDKLTPKYFNELEKFCRDFDIEFNPSWYLGCYVSY